jgi:signal transduction histidine kinase
MTIRYTLLISYVLISLTSVLLITLMIFAHLRELLHTEIETKLQSQAATVMQHIDTTLFERMQNITNWSHLEVMQEIRSRDVDKRLAQFLNELHTGYNGVYQQIFVVNQNRDIIANSDQVISQAQFPVTEPWLQTTLNNQILSLLELDSYGNRLVFSTPIIDSFQQGNLGILYAVFDWQEIFLLMTAPYPMSPSNIVSYALLVDDQGRVIARSAGVQNKVPAFYRIPKNWPLKLTENGAFSANVDFLDNREMFIGYAHSKGYRNFLGFGWHLIIMQPNEHAFASVWKLWQTLLMFLGLTLLLGILMSFWISAKIANPIIKLAEFTRDFMQDKEKQPPVLKASGEVAELNNQFIKMIGNLEQSRQDVVRVAKLAVIGEMAASMAHEVRTPLGILRSSAQMLQRESELSEIGKEMIGFILSESQRLNDLVTTLLKCARPSMPDFAQHEIKSIIEHTVNLLQAQADAKYITLTVDKSLESHLINGDRDQLTQVFLNLIINGLQHTPEHGDILISAKSIGLTLDICVCDNGAGVSNALKQTVFEPFYTGRHDGIGLGLTVVQQIVLAHQGKIYITDNPSGGACFHVELPLIKG